MRILGIVAALLVLAVAGVWLLASGGAQAQQLPTPTPTEEPTVAATPTATVEATEVAPTDTPAATALPETGSRATGGSSGDVGLVVALVGGLGAALAAGAGAMVLRRRQA